MNLEMVIARAVHLGTCLLVFGLDVFAILILPATLTQTTELTWRRRRRIVAWAALLLLVLSGVAWFMLVTIDITDPPLTAAGMRLIWVRTHFGRLWQLRSILAVAVVATQPFVGVRWVRPISLLLTAALLASLAWSGHGQLGGWLTVHLTNDAVHLLAAGLWPTGLVPLALVLASRSISTADAMSVLVRFSRMSVVCVCVLVASGIVNTLLTLPHLTDLYETRYGAVLIGKIAVVTVMIAIGNLNRRAVKRLDPSSIRRPLMVEIALSVAVVVATATLGTLAP